jgi:hypothetical protein
VTPRAHRRSRVAPFRRGVAFCGAWAVRLPVPCLVTATVVLAVSSSLTLLGASQLGPATAHLLQLALAGSAAFLLDDPAAELTGVVPPSLWRRRLPRVAGGCLAIAAAWIVVLLQAPALPARALSIELVVLAAVALAASASAAQHGDSEPGVLVAPVFVLCGMSVLLAGMVTGVALFPSAEAPHPTLLLGCWVGLGLFAVGLALLATRDPAGRSLGARSPAPPNS